MVDAKKHNKAQLIEMAQNRGLVVTEEMSKEDVAEMINADESAAKDEGPMVNDAESSAPQAGMDALEKEQKEMEKALLKASVAKISGKGVLVLEWIRAIEPPDWYVLISKIPPVQKKFEAVTILWTDENGSESKRSFYRMPDNKYTRDQFSNNKDIRKVPKDEYDEDIKMRLAMADLEAQKQANKHKKQMRRERLKGF